MNITELSPQEKKLLLLGLAHLDESLRREYDAAKSPSYQHELREKFAEVRTMELKLKGAR